MEDFSQTRVQYREEPEKRKPDVLYTHISAHIY